MSESTPFLMNNGGAVLFVIVFVEQAGLPLPAAPWLLAAGALSASGQLNLALAIAVTVLASVAADWIWFYIGRRGGQRVLRWFCRLSLAPNACVGRTRGLFDRHGAKSLAAAKFVPGLGAVMPPLAGALGVSTSRFLLFDGFGSLLYGTSYIAIGFLFHNQVHEALGVLDNLGLGAMLVALVFVTGYIALKWVRRLRPVPIEAGGRASSPVGVLRQPRSVDSSDALVQATLCHP
jgi:membrane protein DedA with SNARE-associated domain